MNKQVQYVERETGRILSEKCLWEGIFQWLFNSRLGRATQHLLFQSRTIHRFIQWYADSGWSRWHIRRFISMVQVDLSEVIESNPQNYESFNGFFTRQNRPECRPIAQEPDLFVSPCDGKLLVLPEIGSDTQITVKGIPLNVGTLIGDGKSAARYTGGSAAILRLYLADCHRLYFPADGVPSVPVAIHGYHYPVSPYSGNDVNFYQKNKRTVTLFDTEQFGLLTLIDVGGFLISSIRFSYTPGEHVRKGEEKGCFAFGGSTLVILIEPERIRWDADLLDNSAKGLESYVKLGTRLGIVPQER